MNKKFILVCENKPNNFEPIYWTNEEENLYIMADKLNKDFYNDIDEKLKLAKVKINELTNYRKPNYFYISYSGPVIDFKITSKTQEFTKPDYIPYYIIVVFIYPCVKHLKPIWAVLARIA